MKRTAVDPPDEPRHGRRQPQTSCDSCRKRKLNSDLSASDSILRRLRALEEAVFDNHSSHANTPLSSAMEAEDHQPAPTATMPLGRLGTLKFGIAPIQSPNPFAFAGGPALEQGFVWMMPREQAMALLQDYLDHVYPLLPVIHGPTTRHLIRKFYDGLSRREQLTPQTAALILGMSAISAYFWQPDTGHHSRFASAKEAAQASLLWRDWASDILTNTPQESGNTTLEGVQAWTLLSFMVQNVEGASYRFRFLHNCSLAAARELLLHLVDSPKSDRSEDRVTRELKRRIWWHAAVTDWLLGFMGGPTEGTYSVQPRHMNVKYPKNMNDNDMATFDESTNAPVNLSTQMSYFLQRIRIGEIIRAVLDASHPGGPDVDITDYNQVLTLDHLFEQAFIDLPPFFQSQGPLPPKKLDTLELQRVIIQLGLLSRRARLHRPFLLGQCRYEPHHQRSREICLQSTRAVVSLSISIIEFSLNVDETDANTNTSKPRSAGLGTARTDTGTGLSAHRLGLVINHLSTACTVLAIYAGANPASGSGNNHLPAPGGGGGGPQDSVADGVDRTAVSDELAQACRVLGALGAESPVAADLLRNLVGLLKRYRVVQGAAPDGGGDESREQQQQQQQPADIATTATTITTPATAATTSEELPWRAPGQVEAAPGFAGPMPPLPLVDEEGALAAVGDNSAFSLDGLWDDFVMGSSEDYNQLFADLDYYCGIA
ncbi:hypothetical protein C8A01DRAFT_34543 [Parachaetomium inaequale]|uniref:Xylanolytic transcriptional activator regulatory domain-containing protein n=1 Tax=Parachaetomium inaequale TaxID=2588326 RepID=A0AAN6PLU6_9PEZI|nr:hypothetical protein C8A01DRAFT_34543 [Parachaetomium inaequale]